MNRTYLPLCIVRNKDIVFNDTVRLSEGAVFEKNRISFSIGVIISFFASYFPVRDALKYSPAVILRGE